MREVGGWMEVDGVPLPDAPREYFTLIVLPTLIPAGLTYPPAGRWRPLAGQGREKQGEAGCGRMMIER